MYKIIYDTDGKPCCINKTSFDGGICSIPIAENNSEFREFLSWNKKQKTPLDYNKKIVVETVKEKSIAERVSELETLISEDKK